MRRTAFSVILILFVCSAVGGVPTVVDVHVDMEAGSNGDLITTALLNTSTHGTGGTWSLQPSPLTGFKIATSGETAFPGRITAGGSTYSETGTRGFAFDHSIGTEAIRWTFTANKNDLSLGCFVSFGIPLGYYSNFDYIVVMGDYYILAVNLKTTTPANAVRAELAHGGTTWGPDIGVTPGKVYWLTAMVHSAVSGSNAGIRVYDPATWSLVGESSGPIDDNTPVQMIDFGIQNASAEHLSVFSYWDDILMDWSTAAYPLLPDYLGSGGRLRIRRPI